MRFMMLVYPGPGAEQGRMPDPEVLGRMMKFNEELAASGALLDLNGLQPTSKGVRVSYSGGRPTVTDGPFTESKELLGGYWMIKVGSLDEAVEWAKKAPMQADERIEVRQVFEMEDFAPEVRDEDAERRVAGALANA